jgi:DNA-binding IclR family transcriptional regulator
LAYAYYWSDPLVALAMPKLIDLSQQLNETINLAQLSGEQIVYVSRLPCQRSYFAATVVGRSLPALSTSAGRAMLSTHSEEARKTAVETWVLRQFTQHTTLDRALIGARIQQAAEEGFAISHGQMILNEIGVAAPITGPDGLAHAAVQCSVSSTHWDEARVREEIVPHLLDTARAISPTGRNGG